MNKLLSYIIAFLVFFYACGEQDKRNKLSNGEGEKCWEFFSTKFLRKATKYNLSKLKSFINGVTIKGDGTFEEFDYDLEGNKRVPFIRVDNLGNTSWFLKSNDSISFAGKTAKIIKLTEDTLILFFHNDTLGLIKCGISPLSPAYKK